MTKTKIKQSSFALNPVRRTTFFVLGKARHARINQTRVQEIARMPTLLSHKENVWPATFHLTEKNPQRLLTYLFLLDSLNFCFWSKGERWSITEGGKTYNGYFALSLALKTFFEVYPEKLDFRCLQTLSFPKFTDMLRGGEHLLFLKERWRIVRTVSAVFAHRYGNDPVRFVAAARGSVPRLLAKIVRELPSFNDSAVYCGRRIYFLKRAQIVIGDMWLALEGKGIGNLKNLDYLTAFPDYKLPQILSHWGIIEYSPSLEKKIMRKTLLPAGSPEEVEIRSATVWAVEFLKEELARLGNKTSAMRLDWILWNKSKEINLPNPYHLTKTIFY